MGLEQERQIQAERRLEEEIQGWRQLQEEEESAGDMQLLFPYSQTS